MPHATSSDRTTYSKHRKEKASKSIKNRDLYVYSHTLDQRDRQAFPQNPPALSPHTILFFFSIIVYIPYYSVLVSDAQHSG